VSASAILRVDPGVRDRLAALAAARGVAPADLLAELVREAETAQVVDEVDRELERLSRGPGEQPSQSTEMRELDATVTTWMRD
jgi:hypothetical protein